MPFLAAPIIGGIAAAGTSAAIQGAVSSGQQNAQNQAAAAQQAQAQKNAQAALGTQQVQDAIGTLGTENQIQQQIAAQNGIQNQSNIYNTYGQIAQGQGPNPAQQLLANQTGANISSQAALMAGQRGAGANAGLLARQAAQQGAATQQQAVGQAAALQSQQQLAALGQQANIANSQVGEQLSAQQLAAQTAQANQATAVGALTGANQISGSLGNTALQGQNASNQQLAGQIGNAVSGGISGIGSGLAAGGTGTAGGATTANTAANNGYSLGVTPQSSSSGNIFGVNTQFAEGGPVSMIGKHFAKIKMAKGGKVHGKVPALVSPGERYLPPKAVKEVAEGKKSPMKAGEKIPGEPKVSGAKNSYANDTVPKTLEEGGIVLPRSVTQSKHPHWAAHKFVSAIMARQGMPMKPKMSKKAS